MPAVDREACRPREPTSYGSTDLQHRLVQACQPLSLVSFHGLYRRFKYLHPTSYLALTRLVVARKGRLSRIGPRSSRLALRYIVRAATLFMPLGPPGGTGGLSFINNSLKRLRVAKLGKLNAYPQPSADSPGRPSVYLTVGWVPAIRRTRKNEPAICRLINGYQVVTSSTETLDPSLVPC